MVLSGVCGAEEDSSSPSASPEEITGGITVLARPSGGEGPGTGGEASAGEGELTGQERQLGKRRCASSWSL